MLSFQYLKQFFPEEQDQEQVAKLLGLEFREPVPLKEKKPGPQQSIALPPVTELPPESPSAVRFPPDEKNLQFPYVYGYEPIQVNTSTEQPDWYRKTDVFIDAIESPIGQPAPPVPLSTWEEIWPYLHNLFRDYKQTNTLDTRRIIDSTIKRKPLTRIPWKNKLRWPAGMVLIVDCSQHLNPFYNDYLALARSINEWFRGRVRVVVCIDSERQLYVYEGSLHEGFPLQGANQHILYTGDLGLLDNQGISRARWFLLAQSLCFQGTRFDALLIVHPTDWDTRLENHIRLHHWDSGTLTSVRGNICTGQGALHNSREQTEELLAFLSMAIQISPGLVRGVRQRLGLHVSVEALIRQHGALYGNNQRFQWCSKDVQKKYAERLCTMDQGLREEVWNIIAACESILPFELQIEQRQKAGKKLNGKQVAFVRRLVKSVKEQTIPADNEMVLDWIGRMIERSTGEQWGETVGLLAQYYNKRKPDVSVPVEVDWSEVSEWDFPSGEERNVVLLHSGNSLHLRSADEASTSGVEIARCTVNRKSALEIISGIETGKRSVMEDQTIALSEGVQEVRVSGAAEKLTIRTMTCPHWATGIGRDRYGLFTEVTVKGVSFIMRWIEPGRFLMGSPEGEAERSSSEGPQHEVTLATGFWLADTACSQELWLAVMGNNPSRFSEDSQLQHPVENVGQKMLKEFITKLNKELGDEAFCLLSEAQWEYACRAGTTTPFWFGESLNPELANYNGKYPYNNGKEGTSREQTMPVRSFQPNPWGLYQMHGNVWELCQDGWHDSYKDAPQDGAPWEEGGEEGRTVCRGGSWNDDGWSLRSAYRYIDAIDYGNIGFRLARGPL
jgi:formylglycine-generating enzyme required for sulfatase activity